MRIERKQERMLTGDYKASVIVDKTTVEISGRFEIPDAGSQFQFALEQAIRNDIEIKVTQFDFDPEEAKTHEGVD